MARAIVEPVVGRDRLRRLARMRSYAMSAGGLRPLPSIAAAYGSDKWGQHWYAQHYHRHLSHLRMARFTLLEIGVGGYEDSSSGGKSLRMWKRFFPRAQIVGLDIHPKYGVQEDRIRVFQGDQSDPDFLEWVIGRVGSPKVVIDDGSHVSKHVRASFAALFPHLENGGFYCIEDLQTSYWPSFGGSADVNDPSTSMALVKELVDGLNHREFLALDDTPTYAQQRVVAVHAYHNLAVVQKGYNDEWSARWPDAGL